MIVTPWNCTSRAFSGSCEVGVWHGHCIISSSDSRKPLRLWFFTLSKSSDYFPLHLARYVDLPPFRRISCDSVRFVYCVFNPPLIPFLPASTMPTSATILEQDEIPGQPSSATVREYALETLSEMKEDFIHATLSEDPSCVVGVSLGLARSGPHIRTLALATPANVFNLVLHRPPSPAQKRILRALFSKVPCLAGFELPYIIVLLAHTIGGEISGHDLSSAKFGSKTSYMRMPGALIRSKVSSASAGCINERWERGMPCSDTKSTHTLEPNHRVRAWFTAMCVACVSLAL
jgi:hypothetical protein